MKILFCAITLIAAFVNGALGQGTLLVDQQAGPDFSSEGLVILPQYSPLGQSFTPTFFSIAYIQLTTGDRNANNGLGATLYLNLRSTSFTGTIIGSTTPVVMPDNYVFQPTTFYFPSSVVLTPGIQYFFEVVLQAGDAWYVRDGNNFNYAGGVGYYNGAPGAGSISDLWFREGAVVPEPSATWLLLAGGAGLWFHRRVKSFTRRTWI